MTLLSNIIQTMNKAGVELAYDLVSALGGVPREDLAKAMSENEGLRDFVEEGRKHLKSALALDSFAKAIGIEQIQVKHTPFDDDEGPGYMAEFVIDWDEAKAVQMFASMGIKIEFPEPQDSTPPHDGDDPADVVAAMDDDDDEDDMDIDRGYGSF